MITTKLANDLSGDPFHDWPARPPYYVGSRKVVKPTNSFEAASRRVHGARSEQYLARMFFKNVGPESDAILDRIDGEYPANIVDAQFRKSFVYRVVDFIRIKVQRVPKVVGSKDWMAGHLREVSIGKFDGVLPVVAAFKFNLEIGKSEMFPRVKNRTTPNIVGAPSQKRVADPSGDYDSNKGKDIPHARIFLLRRPALN